MNRSKSKSIVFALSLLLGCSLGKEAAIADCCDGRITCKNSLGAILGSIVIGYTSGGANMGCCKPVGSDSDLRQKCNDTYGKKGEDSCKGDCSYDVNSGCGRAWVFSPSECPKAATRNSPSSTPKKKPSKGSGRE